MENFVFKYLDVSNSLQLQVQHKILKHYNIKVNGM